MLRSENPFAEWPIGLPLYPPADVLDNSQIETFQRCPRKYLYRYGMRRAPLGKNFPIAFGVAYHKYREVVSTELLAQEGERELTNEIHFKAVSAALELWPEDPPLGHRHEHLSRTRLLSSIEEARTRITVELRTGRIVTTRAEDSFDLELPFFHCDRCGNVFIWRKDLEVHDAPTCCSRCGCERVRPSRHGGRMDENIEYRSRPMVRDYKTTGRMGKTYQDRFDPNNQMTGYTWSQEELSGRQSDGVLIEVLYNTKRQGPEFHQFQATRSPGQIEQWIGSMYGSHKMLRMLWSEVADLGYLAFPQFTLACDDFGGCFYRDACRQDSSWAIENWLENNTEYSEWDFAAPTEGPKGDDI